MKANCEFCGNSFNQTRADKRFCSTTCRSKNNKGAGLGVVHTPAVEPANFHSWPGGTGKEFEAYLRAENTELKRQLAERIQKCEDLKDKVRELKIEKKYLELDGEKAQFDKSNGLSGLAESIGIKELIPEVLGAVKDMYIASKTGAAGGEAADFFAGLEPNHKEHLSTLVEALRADEEFTEVVTALALKLQETPDKLPAIIAILQGKKSTTKPNNEGTKGTEFDGVNAA